jgi:hypothetical protein
MIEIKLVKNFDTLYLTDLKKITGMSKKVNDESKTIWYQIFVDARTFYVDELEFNRVKELFDEAEWDEDERKQFLIKSMS